MDEQLSIQFRMCVSLTQKGIVPLDSFSLSFAIPIFGVAVKELHFVMSTRRSALECLMLSHFHLSAPFALSLIVAMTISHSSRLLVHFPSDSEKSVTCFPVSPFLLSRDKQTDTHFVW